MKAQQTVIDALCMDHKNLRKTVLCHTPSELRAGTGIFLSTQDRLVELFTSEMESTIAVFPNMSVVRRLCKQSLYEASPKGISHYTRAGSKYSNA